MMTLRNTGATIAILCFTAASQADAQATGSIRGVVRDQAGRPVANATVNVGGSRSSGRTSTRGDFRLDGLAAGRHVVVISAVSFERYEDTVEVRAGAATEVSVELQRGATSLSAVVIREALPPDQSGQRPTWPDRSCSRA